MSYTFVTLPDDVASFGRFKKTCLSGMVLNNMSEGGVRFVRGKMTAFDSTEPVHRSYWHLSVSEWWAFASAMALDMTVDVRKGGVDQSISANWISFITIGLTTSWSRVITVNYDKNSGLHIYHAPDQNTRSGYTRYSNPVLNDDTWYTLRLTMDLNAGTVMLYCNGVAVESNTINNANTYAISQYHGGFYAYNSVNSGYIDNKNTIIGLQP